MLVPFLVSALATGAIIVYFLPFAQAQLSAIPGFSTVTSNRLVQLVAVGAIVLAGLALFGQLARRIKL